MATHIAARLRADSSAPPTFANRLHVLLIERRVAISMALLALLVVIDVVVLRIRPHDVLNLADGFTAVGIGLVLLGLLMRSWAAGMLRKDKRLITAGPYGIVRNPLYVGSFLMMAGFCTLIGHWLTGLLVAVPMSLMYWLAVRDEELILARFFPNEWPAYAARVPRFFPRFGWPDWHGWSLTQWRNNHEFKAWLGAAIALTGLRTWWML